MSGDRRAAQPRTWARQAVTAAGTARPDAEAAAEPLDLVRAVVAAVARGLPGSPIGWPALAALADDASLTLADRLPEPPGGWADPWLPGLVHEQAVTVERRSVRGAWYTPEPVVRGLVALATADGIPPPAVVDPTCGGGAFLLAALDRYVELGVGPAEALARIAGTDIDPGAITVSRWSVQLWAAARGLDLGDGDLGDGDLGDGDLAGGFGVGPDITVGDALDGPPPHWPSPRLVIGNPPFATPLRSGAVPPAAEAVRDANRDLLGPYSDLAAIHLLAALQSVGPGSTVALVQPQSVLAGRDTGGLRRHCDREAPLQALWATRQAVFDADVRACAVVLRPGSPSPSAVSLAAGPEVTPVASAEADPSPREPGHWAGLAARALGGPVLPRSLWAGSGPGSGPDPGSQPGPGSGPGPGSQPRPGSGPGLGQLADLATATAGFRDEYYGLVDACREWQGEPGAEPNRLVTVGAVDPLATTWGQRPIRFGGRTWERPVIDVGSLEGRVREWTEQRLVPKVVLATQSRVLEPVVDRAGQLVPATPLVAVTACDPSDLDRVAAVLLAPPVVAWAWQRWFGAALSVDALKLAARQVLELPLPPDREAWDEAEVLVARSGGLDVAAGRQLAVEVAGIMNRAYRAGSEVLDWWTARACR